jgi:hypothetical protein
MKIRNGSSAQNVSFQTFAVGVGSRTYEVAIVKFISLTELWSAFFIHTFFFQFYVTLIYRMQLQSNDDRASQYGYTYTVYIRMLTELMNSMCFITLHRCIVKYIHSL